MNSRSGPVPPAPPERDPDEPAPWFRSYSTSSVGIEIVVATMLGLGGGFWLEKNVTHWSPWTTLLGLLVGLGAAGKAVARTITDYKRANDVERVNAPVGEADHSLASPAVHATAVPEPDDGARDESPIRD